MHDHARSVFKTGLGLLVAAAAAPVTAEEVTVQNDSFVSGGFANPVGDFVPGEHAGVRLTSPCVGAIVAVQVGWLAPRPGQLPTLERAIHIYEGNTFPEPGPQLEELVGPVMTPGFINEFRYLDDTKVFPLSVPVTAGQQFYVTLEFDNPTDIGNGGPSVFSDIDGCQAGSNVLSAIPGGWLDFCLLIPGDLVIRAVVDCGGAPCEWDCGDDDGMVGIIDFLSLLAQWGAVGTSCDVDGGGVGITDLLELLANWGACP